MTELGALPVLLLDEEVAFFAVWAGTPGDAALELFRCRGGLPMLT